MSSNNQIAQTILNDDRKLLLSEQYLMKALKKQNNINKNKYC